MRILRVLRLVRIIRLVRVLRLIGELRTIVICIAGSLRPLAWTVALLMLLIYIKARGLPPPARSPHAICTISPTPAGSCIHECQRWSDSSRHCLSMNCRRNAGLHNCQSALVYV